MKVIVDIKDDKVSFMMEVLKNFKSVKSVNLSSYKEDILDGIEKGFEEMKPILAKDLNLTKKEKKILKNIEEGVEEINLIKAGKLKGIPVEELFDEL